MLYVFLLLNIVFVFVALNFRKVDIQVNQEYVRVSYGIIKRTISSEEIISCKPTKTKLPLYGGVGLRLGEKDLPHYKVGNAIQIAGKNGKSFIRNKPTEPLALIADLFMRNMQKLEN